MQDTDALASIGEVFKYQSLIEVNASFGGSNTSALYTGYQSLIEVNARTTDCVHIDFITYM